MDVNDDLVLKKNDRAKLDDIVSKMTNNKESDEDINFVVNDFKSKYGTTQDEVEKKNITSTSNVEGGTSTSAYAPPSLHPEHRVAINEHLVDNTKKAFLTNPAFDDSNPRAEKNKETYINNLVGQGFDKSMLLKTSKEVSDNKKLLVDAQQRLNQKTGIDPVTQETVALNPQNDPNITYTIGTALLGLNKPDDAIKMFQTTINNLNNQQKQNISIQGELSINTPKGQSSYSSSFFGLGSALAKKGDYKSSLEAFNNAISESENDEKPYETQINAYKGAAYSAAKMGDKKSSQQYLEQANTLEEIYKERIGLKQLGAPTSLSEQIGVEAKNEQEQQRLSNHMKDIANGLEAMVTYPVRLPYEVGKESVEAVGSNLYKAGQAGFEYLKAKAIGGKDKDKLEAEAAVKGGAGLMGSGFAIASLLNPELFVFNVGAKSIQDAAEVNPENETLQTVADATTIPFSIYSHIAKWTGNEPTTESEKNIAEIIDVTLMMGAHHVGMKGVKSTKDLINFSKKAAAGELPIEEIKKINLFNDYAKNLTLDNFKVELDKQNTPEAKAILNNIKKQEARDSELKTIQSKRAELGQAEDILSIPTNVSSVIDRISTGKPTDPIALTEAKTHLFNEYKRLQKLKSDNNRMFTIEQINDAQEMLHKAAAEIDTHQHNERVVSPELKELQDKKDKLEEDKKKMDATNPGSSIIIQPKIDAIDVQIQNVASADSSVHHEAAADAVRLGEIDDQVKALEESKKGLSQESQDEIDKHITNLNTEKNAIQKPSTERNVPLPGATGETITEGGEGVRQGIKGDEVAKEGEEKVVQPKATLFSKPLETVKNIVKRYTDKAGIKHETAKPIESIDKVRAKKISDAYEKMKHDPNNPEVKKAYEAMAKETLDQYNEILKDGYEIEINNEEPYDSSAHMIEDLRKNKRMKVFSTESGFGDTPITEKQRAENPLLRDSGLKDKNGKPLLINDIFRFVHDFFGHADMGNGFGAVGEENAWNAHSRMYSPEARRAMTTETRGQNSFVNFSGVNKEAFKIRDEARKLKAEGDIEGARKKVGEAYEMMKFAEQKVGLLPEEFTKTDKELGVEPKAKKVIPADKAKYDIAKLKEGHGKATAADKALIKDYEAKSSQTAVIEKTKEQASDVIKALKSIAPDATVELHETPEAFSDAANKAGANAQESRNAGGFFDPNTNTLHLNLEKISSNTLFHEGVHPILNAIAAIKSDLIDDLHNQLLDVEKKLGVEGKYSKEFAGQYDEPSRKMEALTEFIADVADGKVKLDSTTFEKVKEIIVKMLDAVGIKLPENIKSTDDLISIAKKISKGFEAGKEIKIEKGKTEFIDSNGNPLTNEKLQFSIQNDFSDVKSKTTFTYLKNSEAFEKLKKEGIVTENKKLEDFDGKYIFLHSPDGAFTGDIIKNGEKLVEGKGGMLYPIKFHDEGYFWASTKGGANSMVKQLNESARLNGGKAYMALTSAPHDKLLSSTTAANGVLDIFSSKVLDKNVKIGENDIKSAIVKAAKSREVVNKKNVGLELKVDSKESLENIKNIIKEKLSPDNSTFADRKHFVEQVIKNVVDNIKGKKSEQKLAEFLHLGISNIEMKGITKKGYKLSKANVVSAISYMLQEPLLRNDKKAGSVYAILELDGKSIGGEVVEPVKSTKHESYPIAIKSKDGVSKTKLHILQDRNAWNENFNDPETGKTVLKERELNIFPTSGVSTSPLELKVKSEPKIQFQKPKKGVDLVEKAGKRKEMTEDKEGNYLFFHYSDAKFSELKPDKVGKHLATSRGESPRIKTSQFYTRPDRLEPNVPNANGYVVKVSKEKVYHFNTDPLNLLPEAEKRFRKENGKDVAFDLNNQVAYVSKVAGEKGFTVTTSDWNIKGTKALRAQTTEPLKVEKYSNIKPGTSNQIEFNPKYEDVKPNARRRDIQYSLGEEGLSDVFERTSKTATSHSIEKGLEELKDSDYYKSLDKEGKQSVEEYFKEHHGEESEGTVIDKFNVLDKIAKEFEKGNVTSALRKERSRIFDENPKIKEVNDNFKKITSQLEGTEEFKKSDGCP